ncbi:MAG: hypothetical protein RQ741_13835 [Wenzhouxiangellaceae bacterium]|nr:hypothetical protein [Wenzhouxiangellaceae bacterium]
MSRSTFIASARIPDTDSKLKLHRYADRFSISIPGRGELMNSRVHGSEKALADLSCARLGERKSPRVLIGGLGMGFTLAAALKALGPGAEVVVAELVPEVVDWNREHIGEPAGHPLNDPRSVVYVGDVGRLLRESPIGFDAIMLDVDNGPEGLIRRENDWLYSIAGLNAARRALTDGGLLAIWSASPDKQFTARLEKSGFSTELVMVRPHRAGKGARHYIWVCSVARTAD